MTNSSSTDPDGDPLIPPAKRPKTGRVAEEQNKRARSVSRGDIITPPYNQEDEILDSGEENDLESERRTASINPTELESVLPPLDPDPESIGEYEAKSSSEETPQGLEDRLSQRKWIKGRSSIYVDAFNLALETVLADESHLFDEKEIEVFDQWKSLDYEAQYL